MHWNTILYTSFNIFSAIGTWLWVDITLRPCLTFDQNYQHLASMTILLLTSTMPVCWQRQWNQQQRWQAAQWRRREKWIIGHHERREQVLIHKSLNKLELLSLYKTCSIQTFRINCSSRTNDIPWFSVRGRTTHGAVRAIPAAEETGRGRRSLPGAASGSY